MLPIHLLLPAVAINVCAQAGSQRDLLLYLFISFFENGTKNEDHSFFFVKRNGMSSSIQTPPSTSATPIMWPKCKHTISGSSTTPAMTSTSWHTTTHVPAFATKPTQTAPVNRYVSNINYINIRAYSHYTSTPRAARPTLYWMVVPTSPVCAQTSQCASHWSSTRHVRQRRRATACASS